MCSLNKTFVFARVRVTVNVCACVCVQFLMYAFSGFKINFTANKGASKATAVRLLLDDRQMSVTSK